MRRRAFLGVAGASLCGGCVDRLGSDGRGRRSAASTRGQVTCERGSESDATGPGRVHWPQSLGRTANTGYREEMAGPEACPSVQWTWSFDYENAFHGTPVGVDGTLLLPNGSGAETDDGSSPGLLAFDPATGERRWTAGTGRVRPRPTVVDGVAFTGHRRPPRPPRAAAFDLADREWLWRADEGETATFAAQVVGDGRVYGRSRAGTLVARDASTGDVVWEFEADANDVDADGEDGESEAVRQGFGGPPTYRDGTVYAGTWRGGLYAVDAATGERAWRFDVRESLESSNGLTHGVAVTDDAVFASQNGSGSTFALDRATGALRWSAYSQALKDVPPVVADGTVYAVGEGQKPVAFDAETGDVRWRGDYQLFTGGLAVGDRTVYGLSGDVFAFDRETGRLRWRFEPAATVEGGVVLGERSLFVTDEDGTLYGLW